MLAAAARGPHMLLLTVHEAKGGEWPFVYVHDDLYRHVLSRRNDATYQLNLLYVAITRATHVLYLPPAIVSSWIGPTGVVL